MGYPQNDGLIVIADIKPDHLILFAMLFMQQGNDIYDFEVPAKQVYKFIIPPKVSHAIKNIGEKDNILIAFNTLAHDNQNPDVINDILIDK